MIKAILTDIEGTTSSISFVHDVLFPYAYEKMGDFLSQHWHDETVKNAVGEVAKIENLDSYTPSQITSILQDWIKCDRKLTPLKDLQGIIWETGYKNQDFCSHVYEDAYEKLKLWHSQNIPIYIYSSGSIHAQKLFFAHTQYGDLLYLFSGFFDTNIGNKKEPNSYEKISQSIGLNPNYIIFLSDVEAEVNSASQVQMKTVLVARDLQTFNQLNIEQQTSHQLVKSFAEINIENNNK
ncbi:acireductone synthase [Cyanobacterium aponinum UTEX 3222]|uniref:Enolase-phosphatase E1 n=2 Tax=Cyanobacterium aponinum TaxID=379064 RepID=A0A844GSH0_9CHRO|nr:acireductone synthase [Cyanobacterium aponinum]WRL42222.1 acireductone synthase [Cyanobacterium aponinum UTEX 3222]MBD2395258.1 acireductone synthase [Cyanobacterium aponinum FACHB-4101]MTF38011.1 acireductone synthase [Cyanobacterium aponinum 0216]PHV61727.1 acireductone synthase [Cyanobacterium aponinum IPPAS B-1201]WPF87643.1 acireductone synthase [Cyanobacterium aponinum AL20115]